MSADHARRIAFDSRCGPPVCLRLFRPCLPGASEDPAPPGRSALALPTDVVTTPCVRKRSPANQAFPNLFFGCALRHRYSVPSANDRAELFASAVGSAKGSPLPWGRSRCSQSPDGRHFLAPAFDSKPWARLLSPRSQQYGYNAWMKLTHSGQHPCSGHSRNACRIYRIEAANYPEWGTEIAPPADRTTLKWTPNLGPAVKV